MPSSRDHTASRLRRLTGRKVAEIVLQDEGLLRIQFTDGAVLTVSRQADALAVQVTLEPEPEVDDSSPRPTERQAQYLAFIAKYIQRFGRAPAESDIQRHFLVSAPTVNQMVQMLERRGFITRQPGVARSIRLRIEVPPS
jgi:hypothetical protein